MTESTLSENKRRGNYWIFLTYIYIFNENILMWIIYYLQNIFDLSFSCMYSSSCSFFPTGNKKKTWKIEKWKPHAGWTISVSMAYVMGKIGKRIKRASSISCLQIHKLSFQSIFLFSINIQSMSLVLIIDWRAEKLSCFKSQIGSEYGGYLIYLEILMKDHSIEVNDYYQLIGLSFSLLLEV